jgi:hypothetical protein
MEFVAGLIAIAVGLLNCFYGYRIFKLFLVISGFVLGFALGASLVSNNQTAAIIVGLIGGLIGAGLMNLLYGLSVFVAGIVFGAVVTGALLSALNMNAPLLIIVGAIIGAILALTLNKLMLILSTAFSGSAGVVYGLSLMLPDVFALSFVGGKSSILSFFVWLILGIAGASTQYNMNREAMRERRPRRKKKNDRKRD